MTTEYELVLSVRLLRRLLALAEVDDVALRFVSTPSAQKLVVDTAPGLGLSWNEIARVEDGKLIPANKSAQEDVAVGGQYL